MAIAFVRQATGSATSGTTTAATITAPTNGNAVVFFCGSTGATSKTVSSIALTGATCVLLPGSVHNSTGTDFEIWYAPNVSSAGTTATVTWSGTITAGCLNAMEFSGIATASANDGTGTGATHLSGTTIATGNYTTTNANDLILAGVSTQSTSAPSVMPSGFTTGTFVTAGTMGMQPNYEIVTSTGTFNPSWTVVSATAAAGVGGLKAPSTGNKSSFFQFM